MANCPNCHGIGQLSSRTSNEILNQCSKNHRGSCSACSKLRDLDRRIDDARRALDLLLHAREDMASTLNEHHDPFAQQLPIEVVSRVFMHSLPFKVSPSDYLLSVNFNEKQHIDAVFNPGRVCRYWRNVAHRTPELWIIFAATITRTNCVTSISMAQEWLERSGGLGIYIRLRVLYTATDLVFLHSVQRVITSITPHSQRWNTLDIEVPPAVLTFFESEVSNSTLEGLRRITLRVTDEAGNDTLKLAASPLFYATRTSLSRIAVKWDRLGTFVALADVVLSLGECLQLLRAAPRLTGRRIWSVSGDTQHQNSVNHLALQNLAVNTWSAAFWDALACPSLRILTVGRPQNNDARGFVPVKEFLGRSGCRLKELSVSGSTRGRQPDGMVEMFKLTPDLERLIVTGNAVLDGDLFSAMNAAAIAGINLQPTGFLSKLVSLTCIGLRWNWRDLAMLVITMTSRRVQPLRTITFRYHTQSLEDLDGIDMGKDIFKHVMDAVHASGSEFKVVHHESGSDLLGRLRNRYNS